MNAIQSLPQLALIRSSGLGCVHCGMLRVEGPGLPLKVTSEVPQRLIGPSRTLLDLKIQPVWPATDPCTRT